MGIEEICTRTRIKKRFAVRQTSFLFLRPCRFRWRRDRDSNPRYSCPYTAFRVRPDRPLRHLSFNSGAKIAIILIPRRFAVRNLCFVAKNVSRVPAPKGREWRMAALGCRYGWGVAGDVSGRMARVRNPDCREYGSRRGGRNFERKPFTCPPACDLRSVCAVIRFPVRSGEWRQTAKIGLRPEGHYTISSPTLASLTRMVLWNGMKRDITAITSDTMSSQPRISLSDSSRLCC